jgi:hypothetical protein
MASAIDSALGRASTASGLCRRWCLFALVPALLKNLFLRSWWSGSKSWGSGLFGESRQFGLSPNGTPKDQQHCAEGLQALWRYQPIVNYLQFGVG